MASNLEEEEKDMKEYQEYHCNERKAQCLTIACRYIRLRGAEGGGMWAHTKMENFNICKLFYAISQIVIAHYSQKSQHDQTS